MRKLFTLAAVVLASVNLFAATVSFNGQDEMSPQDYFTFEGNHNFNAKFKDASYAGIDFTSGLKMEGSTTINFTTTDATDVTIVQSTWSAKTIKFDGNALAINSAAEGTGCRIYTIEGVAAGSHSITRGDGESGLFYIAVEAACQDPEFTVSEGGVGFVGDQINIAISSLNQSKPIIPAVTVDGVAGVYGTDYTFSASTGLVQATPLKAGTFVIKFTQASNGTYCAAEDSATFVISAKSPVTSFTVEGPTEARIGQEVTLTATNFDAAATVIEWQDGENEVVGTGATYTFTPDAVGNYQFYVYASNEFNENPVMEVHNVEVAISDNALLSDLKVNGETVEDFDEETYAYNLGQIGVYEALSVVATPEDAPYATAVVVDNGEGTITITVTAEDQESTEEYVLTYTRAAATELASISEGTTWDFTKTGATEIKFTDDTPIRKGVTEFNYADVLTNPDASFNAAALNGVAEYAVREGKYFQGSQLIFNTTVPGKLEVVYSNTGNRAADQDLERILTVNGVKIGNGALRSDTDVTESDIEISAGEVVLSSVLKSDESVQYIRIKKVAFTTNDATAIDNAAVTEQATKRIVNGQVIILRDGKTYNALGTEVR